MFPLLYIINTTIKKSIIITRYEEIIIRKYIEIRKIWNHLRYVYNNYEQ